MNEPISQLFNGIKVVQGTCAAWTRGGCRAAAASTEAGRGRMAASNTSWARRPRRVASADNGEVSDEYEAGDDGDEPGEATMVRAGGASLREAVSTATDRHGSSRRRRRRTRWRRRGRSRVTVRRGCLGISRLLRSTVRSEETRDRTSVDGSRQTDEGEVRGSHDGWVAFFSVYRSQLRDQGSNVAKSCAADWRGGSARVGDGRVANWYFLGVEIISKLNFSPI